MLVSQLTIKLSDKADALIAQLQKEIFNRRRKKVSAAGVVETLLESGAKSQSDKRFATSWKNLIADIETAVKVVNAHGSKPSGLSDAEWALILSHRSRSGTATATPARRSTRPKAQPQSAPQPKAKAAPTSQAAAKTKPAAKKKPVAKASVASSRPSVTGTGTGTADAAPKPIRKAASSSRTKPASSAARRMARAASRLSASAQLPTGASAVSGGGASD